VNDLYLKTRKCHNCDRHSWLVAEGKPCPHCGRITGKYHDQTNFIIGWLAVAATVASLFALYWVTP
jgi:hypothetical protein